MKFSLRLTLICLQLFLFPELSFHANAQSGDTISVEGITRIMNILTSDSLEGRGNYQPGLYKAAQFIASEFRKDSLLFMPGQDSYFQPFSIKQGSIMDKRKDSFGNYISPLILQNVIGVIDGRSRRDEVVIFSAHYDHVGTSKEYKGVKDSIFNGANDNASGTTALLTLAHYFAARNDNERTLIFCAFSGEELGLYGSEAFVKRIQQPEQVITVINIEMIGRMRTPDAVFITGAQFSNLNSIIKKTLGKNKIRITNEPNDSKNLFGRSDNYPFVRTGIPAHTIMGSDDTDECYHRPCDEFERMNIQGMKDIIEAIMMGTKTLINGTDTPKRIN